MNILIIGSGGREHALCWKMKQSPRVSRLVCAPGNAGIEQLAETIPVKAHESDALLRFALKEKIDLVVVGPEQSLALGIVDLFERSGVAIFGPDKSAARLESSKVFAKDFMRRHGIPTARYQSFTQSEEAKAREFIESLAVPIVVKADGLAAGKGVVVCGSKQEAVLAVGTMMGEKIFGAAGEKIVIEEFMQGEEASLLVITDGERIAPLPAAQDHKRILDGDRGKNTGGMGAYAPAPLMDKALTDRVVREIVVPTIRGMNSEGTPFRGCLYVGLMITAEGPKVVEYNCRFGDPETQVVVPLIEGDLAEILYSAATRRLNPEQVRTHRASAVCVVMASRGYPDDYETGKKILGLDKIHPEDGVVVFHAGTKKNGEDVLTSGGRVLGVTAIGYDNALESTIRSAYNAVGKITFDGAYFRGDIGRKALKGGR
ncbi:MAG TPA: phosphoribosylamine--glycine ligase [Bacteroidota bacterium]